MFANRLKIGLLHRTWYHKCQSIVWKHTDSPVNKQVLINQDDHSFLRQENGPIRIDFLKKRVVIFKCKQCFLLSTLSAIFSDLLIDPHMYNQGQKCYDKNRSVMTKVLIDSEISRYI